MVKAKEPKPKYGISVVVLFNAGDFSHMLNFDQSSSSMEDLEVYTGVYGKIMSILTSISPPPEDEIPEGSSTD